MMENGFSSPRSENFPAGLRVLVVDDDPTWLKILEKMLKKCSYDVTTCGLARDALNLLRERKDGYDIVISDVNMPDMDGFKLLEHVGLEMDLPVIMMSVDGETSRVMKGVQHGACDYLLKPIRMKELRNIWQHVFRKKILEVRDIESFEGTECIQLMRHGSDQSDDDPLLSVDDLTSSKKRKDVDNKYDDKDFGDLSSSTKKARVVWTVDLHQKFVKAVNLIGFEKVGPKKILDLMNVPWLTRENVASHLQKYRLYLSRLQKDNDCKTPFGSTKHSDLSSKDPAGNFCHQNSFNTHQSDAANGNYAFPASKVLLQNVEPKIQIGDLKGTVSMPMADTKISFTGDVPETQRARNSTMGFSHQFASLETDMKYAAFDSPVLTKYSWSDVPDIQFKKERKSLPQFEDGFNHIPLADATHNHIHGDQLHPAPSLSSQDSIAERNSTSKVETKYPEYKKSHHSSSSGSTIDSFPLQTKTPLVNQEVMEPISTTESSLKTPVFNLNHLSDPESSQKSLNSGTGVRVSYLDEELQFYRVQNESRTNNIGFQNIQFQDYYDPGLITEIPIHLYDALRFDYEFPCDPPEYSLLDQGLFIA